MQFAKKYPLKPLLLQLTSFLPFLLVLALSNKTNAQVSMVEFGKNRVQFQKFKWSYYQTDNFNVYYNQHGEGLAKFVAQIAEQELPELEKFAEYALQRRANIVLYNSLEELKQTNIGLTTDWESSGGNTKLVNNKIVVNYNANHYLLRKQVKQGIAKTLLDNVLFGDDLGEFAANQALLDLPKWLTDGYVSYAAENWSTELDDQLKSVLLSGKYRNFYQFAFDKPMLAGHAFWHYIAENYKKENVTYFLYLSRVYRNTNAASQKICKKKFKEVLADFMDKEEQKYYTDIRSRRNAPKGSLSVVEDITRYKDFFRFTPNPAPRSQTYAVVEYKHGMECVVLYEDYVTRKVLLKSGTRNVENMPNPNYPMMTWDGKGNRLAVVYYDKGKLQMFVYDLLTRLKKNKQVLEGFDMIQDIKFAVDGYTLLMSAVKNGQSDIFTYHIEKEKVEQITNDIFDDLDPSFVAFPNKTGIIFSSNRPNITDRGGDTALPSKNLFNIFLVDNWNKSDFKQISQLSRMRYGNARFPAQYNLSHFTFASDENGIMNRFAGFFQTEKAGIDTIYRIGDDILRNPEYKDIDSLLKAYDKQEPDTIFTFAITNDSAYVFPLTNYQSSLTETRAAGDNGQVSEMRQEGDLKFLYKLKVDEAALKKRNVNPRPTLYRQKLVNEAKISSGEAAIFQQQLLADTSKNNKDIFESGFEADTSKQATALSYELSDPVRPSVLSKSKRFDYKLKFSVDQLTGSLFNNDVLITRYEPYTRALPITLSSNGGFNGMMKVTVYDLFEDLRFTGMIRIPLINTAGAVSINGGGGSIGFLPGTQSLFNSGSESLARFDYLKKRVDFSAMYYRKTDIGTDATQSVPIKLFTNLYQGGIKYPFDRLRSIRINAGYRNDKFVIKGIDNATLKARDSVQKFFLSRIEYVYDNTIEKTTNIRNGLRYKAYVDLNQQLSKITEGGKSGFNFGFDARYYYPIFQNFIWAGRAAGDFSWGSQKILYYLGGADGWLFPKANTNNPAQDPSYAFQSLALNMRGFNQNVANGNNAVTINSEFRFPVFSTLLKRPINNAFLRNFQLVQFIDLGTAWNGAYGDIERPFTIYTDPNGSPDISLKQKAGGIGPFVGGYGVGARSTLLGYFLRFDVAWPMDVFFKGKPIGYFSMGIDF